MEPIASALPSMLGGAGDEALRGGSSPGPLGRLHYASVEPMTSSWLAQGGYSDPGSSALGMQVVIGALMVLLLGLIVWGIVDAFMRPSWAWDAARRSKVFWIIVQLLLPPLASLAYLLVVRREVRAGATVEP